MISIGLTGGIASGKSTVGRLLQDLGAYIVDTDKIAHEIVTPGKTTWQEIKMAFGDSVLNADKTINRRALGDIVFKDKTAREKLEAITHPRIKKEALVQAAVAERARYKVVVFDVPLLIEVGWQHMVDKVWVVYVDKDTQLARLMARDHLTREQALDRLKSQMPLSEKLRYADVVIDNSRDIADTAAQVRAAWLELCLP